MEVTPTSLRVAVPADVTTESPVAATFATLPPPAGLYKKTPLPELVGPKVPPKTTWPALLNGDGGPEFNVRVLKVVPEIGVTSSTAATLDNPLPGEDSKIAFDEEPPTKFEEKTI